MLDVTRRQLLALARRAAQGAYCPYSRFHVGAALLGNDGFLVTGANVENASYGLTSCAERTAIFGGAARGMRRLRAIAVACVDSPTDAPESSRMPCGACRQVIAEFATPTTEILIDGVGTRSLAEILPGAFVLGRDLASVERPTPWVRWESATPAEMPPRYTTTLGAGPCLALVTDDSARAEVAALAGMHAFHLCGAEGPYHHGVRNAAEVWAILDAVVYAPCD